MPDHHPKATSDIFAPTADNLSASHMGGCYFVKNTMCILMRFASCFLPFPLYNILMK